MRVLVVDDHTLVREGIRLLLQSAPYIEVVGEAGDELEAAEKARQLRPDVILMDVAMPRMGGVEATKHIKEEFPSVQVLALTIHDNEEYLFQMLQAGACGYVLKKARPEELVSALEAAECGEVYLSPGMAKSLVEDYLKRVEAGEEEDTYHGLTDREREILSSSPRATPTRRSPECSTSALKPSRPTAPTSWRNSTCTVPQSWSSTPSARASSLWTKSGILNS